MKNKKGLLKSFSYHFFVLIFGLVMIYPVLWMISGSLKDNVEILQGGLNLVPPSWRWQNYVTGWKGFGGTTFATFFANSFIISTISTVATVFSSACIAYAFARFKYRGRNFWFSAMLATLMLPMQVILIPQFLIYNKLGLVGTIIPLILPHFFGVPFFIYQMMQFMKGIPRELDEAATIDGCSKYSIFSKIILPLLKPALITTIVIQFYWKWDDFMGPLIYLNRPSDYTVSYALKLFADSTSTTDYGAMFAMSSLSLVPIFVIFLIFNKRLVEGIKATGLKG
jgi:multiple sugar transport system permease protein